MSDDSTEKRPEHSPEAGREEVERTGVVGVHATQPIPRDPEGSGTPGAQGAGERGWFTEFAGEHPTEGPGVPSRADAVWGSDRADALAEEAHRARYAPPVVPHAPYAYPAEGEGSGESGPSGAAAGGVSGPGQLPESGQSAESSSYPVGLPTQPPARRRRRFLAVTGIVALCLASAVVGGVAGQLLEDRVVRSTSTLPEPGPGVTARPPGSIASIAARVLPSVVTIKVDAGGDGQGTGSGFVLDNKGHVLTNNHVVAAGANGGVIQVVLSNGATEDATVVGHDVSYDLAVLRLKRKDLTPLQLGSSAGVVVGDQVIAVGAPLGLDQTVTTGIVSALNRPVTPGDGNDSSFINAIQTDAAINPGNSGGPLLDMSGKVIGVNSAIARVPGTGSAASGNIGLGFAIPSDQARRTADQLIATGKATHPIIGVLLDRTFSGDGAQVRDRADAVTAGGPAAKAGVKPGDVIVSFEGKPVRTPDQLIVSIRSRAVGDTVKLTIQRDGRQLELQMKLEAQPGD